MTKTIYSEQQKSDALELHRAHGPSEAARRTGISKATIASWARRSGVHTDATARTQEATAARVASFAASRVALADKAGGIADRFFDLAVERAQDGDTRQAKDLVVAAAVAIDKAQLLSGGATQRFDVADAGQRVQEAHELRQQLAAARAANGKQVAS